jgi:hypothetical protein
VFLGFLLMVTAGIGSLLFSPLCFLIVVTSTSTVLQFPFVLIIPAVVMAGN